MDETLLWLIPLAPLAASIGIVMFGKPLGERSHWPCILALAVSAVAALTLLFFGEAGGDPVQTMAISWIHVGGVNVDFSLRADALTAVMLATVTTVSLLVAVYSVGYMHHDEGYARYFAGISFFVFSMTMLVLAADFLVLFIFWEAVGLCSYLLIGHFQTRPSAAAAAKKAFLVNRIGDFGFLLGIFLLWTMMGAVAEPGANRLDFKTVFDSADTLSKQPTALTIACLLLFAGAVGKSAQFPLHTWLPDAMEGPSPVSALIHAATMVTAGVYLIARMTPLLVYAPTAQLVIAGVGAFTALFAALIALTQYDLKRVLAYSTVSQLGFMFLALGSSAGSTDAHLPTIALAAALFHLFTHAFFKALLFLSAGSVMHAMGDVIDMRKFGGLRRTLPYTHIAFFCGAIALAGLPIFAGFWSKDAILDVVAHAAKKSDDSIYFSILFYTTLFTSFLTAFYTFRAYFLTFHGAERFPTEAGEHPHESPPVMLAPLAILSVGALAAGFVFGPGLTVELPMAPELTILPHHSFASYVEQTPWLEPGGPYESRWGVMFLSTAVAVAGVWGAYVLYIRRSTAQDQAPAGLQPLIQASENRFYVDEVYSSLIVRPLEFIAAQLPKFDRHSLDRIVDVIGALPAAAGRALRPIQSGYVQGYGFWMLVGLTVMLVLMVSAFG